MGLSESNRSPAPTLNQHGEEILTDLNYSSEEIAKLKIIGSNGIMSTTETRNAVEAGRFVGSAIGRNYPSDILDAAKMCLVDWCGVALGAQNEEAAAAVRKVAMNWGTNGNAQVLLGGKAAPSAAAMINGTMAHCLDYDDTHVGSTTHVSGPTVASALAVGTHLGASEQDILSAIITGFEVAARLGNGAGQPANLRGFHATGIFGAFGATAAASVLFRLDEARARNAFGAVATQTGGLSASFGTMSKPFHAGKAALNGVLSAELAGEGFIAKEDLLEPDGDLDLNLPRWWCGTGVARFLGRLGDYPKHVQTICGVSSDPCADRRGARPVRSGQGQGCRENRSDRQ